MQPSSWIPLEGWLWWVAWHSPLAVPHAAVLGEGKALWKPLRESLPDYPMGHFLISKLYCPQVSDQFSQDNGLCN